MGNKDLMVNLNLCIDKGYFKIYQYLAQHFVYYGECLSNPPPFYATQMIIPYPHSMISTNH